MLFATRGIPTASPINLNNAFDKSRVEDSIYEKVTLISQQRGNFYSLCDVISKSNSYSPVKEEEIIKAKEYLLSGFDLVS